jgi:hypothetical protein
MFDRTNLAAVVAGTARLLQTAAGQQCANQAMCLQPDLIIQANECTRIKGVGSGGSGRWHLVRSAAYTTVVTLDGTKADVAMSCAFETLFSEPNGHKTHTWQWWRRPWSSRQRRRWPRCTWANGATRKCESVRQNQHQYSQKRANVKQA